jgi:hypothetical protein
VTVGRAASRFVTVRERSSASNGGQKRPSGWDADGGSAHTYWSLCPDVVLMRDHERRFLEEMIDTLAVSIASGMRGESSDRLVDSQHRLTESGRYWVHGYLVGRLTMLKSWTTGNPNLSDDDIREVTELVEGHEASIAAELYG